MTAVPTACRICAVIAATPDAAAQLAAAVAAAPIASVMIRLAGNSPLTAASARPLVELAQKHEIAALIVADAKLARTLRADGVHLPFGADMEETYAAARDIVGGRGIVGADAGTLRHDAMVLGEAGCDYVGFGLSGRRDTAAEHRRELIQWWSEVFEVPCVALDVGTAEEARDLAAAGADFVAVTLPTDGSPADAGRLIAGARTALAAVAAPA